MLAASTHPAGGLLPAETSPFVAAGLSGQGLGGRQQGCSFSEGFLVCEANGGFFRIVTFPSAWS